MSQNETNAPKWQPDDEQRLILNALLEESKKEKTTVDFARKFLPFGRSLFDQIMDVFDPKVARSYFDKISPERRISLIGELEAILDTVQAKRAMLARISTTEILVTSKIRAIETAVRECAVKSGSERIVLCPAPTGGGKTMACNYLAEKFSARLVEVRSAWRRSTTGYVPLIDICKAIGVRVGRSTSVAQMEDDLVRFCEQRNLVLCFDEAEYFGKEALNLLKFLLNKTRIVVVLFVVTSEYDKWADYYKNEAAQIARRIHDVVETSVLEAKDVELFFPKDQFAEPAAALALLVREASRFGHFSLVSRVAAKLKGITGADETDVRKAINRALVQMKQETR